MVVKEETDLHCTEQRGHHRPPPPVVQCDEPLRGS